MKRLLLIVSGGIAAYKALEFCRLAAREGYEITGVLTASAQQFITPLALQGLTHRKVYTELFSLTDENEMGHIKLSREADLVLVAPATANILAKMAAGMADDLATTLLLATDKRVLVAPAMNVRMWEHEATRQNMATLKARGVMVLEPREGAMACGEFGPGRLPEPPDILAAVNALLQDGPLKGRHAIVTSGPTHEPIDPVRYIANRSSGKQGHAIAAALVALGARVTLISGPVSLAPPPGVALVQVETARHMFAATLKALPADLAVCAAAVADWRVEDAVQKIKKDGSGAPPDLHLTENPDILAEISKPGPLRPKLVVGFAAETENLEAHAAAKYARKGCDWMVANNVAQGGIMGGDENEIVLLTREGAETWPRMDKTALAAKLAARMGVFLHEHDR